MALALVFRNGQDFFVEDARFIVSGVGKDTCHVSKDGVLLYTLNDYDWGRLAPEVWVQVGLPNEKDTEGSIRLIFEAPRSVRIYRGDIYRERNGGVK